MTQPNLARDTWLKIVLNSRIWEPSSIKAKTTMWDEQACESTLSWCYQERLVKRNCWKMKRAGERKGVWRKEKPAQGAELQRKCLENKKLLGSGTLPTPGSIFPESSGSGTHWDFSQNLESFLHVCPGFSSQNKCPPMQKHGTHFTPKTDMVSQ